MIENYRLYKGTWIFSKCPHLEKKLSQASVKKLFVRGGVMLRNLFDFDCPEETSFWYVIKDIFGGMEELSSKMRNQVKKSLKTYDVERISPEEFKRIGLSIYNSAQENYRVKTVLTTQDSIDNMAERAHNSEGNIDIWAVYTRDDHKPIAISYNVVHYDCCEYKSMKCDPSYQRNSTYPYYGLIYQMNRYYLQELGLRYVTDGARSITEHSNIQPFLIEKFKFRKAYCHLNIHYKWYFKVAVKILYPFRRFIPLLNVKSILRLEEYNRNS